MGLKSYKNLRTFKYSPNLGWSRTSFPDLDSNNTLVLIFGAADFNRSLKAILKVARAFFKSHILGCVGKHLVL